MSLAFAGFPVATFKTVGDPTMLVLAVIRAECDIKGRCFKSQRYLAVKAGIRASTLNHHVAKLTARGALALIHRGRRRPAVIIIRPEHRWVTPEKPAPAVSECSEASNTKSKAAPEKETPGASAA